MTSLEIKPEHRKCSIPAKLKSFHGQRMRFDLDFTLTMILVPQWFATKHQVDAVLDQFRPSNELVLLLLIKTRAFEDKIHIVLHLNTHISYKIGF